MMIQGFNFTHRIRIILVLIFIASTLSLSIQTVFSEENTLGSSVTTIDWKPDGIYGLIGGTGGLIAKYDGKSVLWQSNIQIEPEHIAWKPDGSTALVVGQGGIFLVNDSINALEIDSNGEYLCADWNPIGSYALIGGRMIDRETYRASLLEYNGTALVDISYLIDDDTNITITHIAWNPISDLALIYTSDGRLYKMWEGGLILTRKTTDILDFAWKPDGSEVLFLYTDLTIAAWDGNPSNDLRIMAAGTTSSSWSSGMISLKQNGNLAVIAGLNSDTNQWSIYKYDGSLKFHEELRDKQVNGIAWHPSDDYALVVGSYGSGGLIQKIVFQDENSGILISPLMVAAPIVAIFGISYIGLTETGRYASLKLLFLPLFAKLRKKHPLEHKMRELIYEYVKLYPGQNYTTIKKTLGLANGTLVYHLEILKKAKLIRSVSDGRYKRFYTMKSDELDESEIYEYEGAQMLTDIQKKIIKKIEKKPEITQGEVAKLLGVSRQLVNYHISKLVKAGLLKIKKKSDSNSCA